MSFWEFFEFPALSTHLDYPRESTPERDAQLTEKILEENARIPEIF